MADESAPAAPTKLADFPKGCTLFEVWEADLPVAMMGPFGVLAYDSMPPRPYDFEELMRWGKADPCSPERFAELASKFGVDLL